MDPIDVVRKGYNAIAETYLQERTLDSPDVQLLTELEDRLPEASRVLDLGCGAGTPITLRLAEKYRVVGMDFSDSQLALARKAVPNAEFRLVDMVTADLGEAEFDGVCSYYAIIHIPREHHQSILEKIHRALRPNGIALLCLGAEALENDYDEYMGVQMYWSHFDAVTYRRMLAYVGFTLEVDKIVADAASPGAGHFFALARKS